MELLPNPHPGEILEKEFLEPLDMSPKMLAERIGLPESVIKELIAGERPVNADIALRLHRFFGPSAKMWLGLQQAYEQEEVKRADMSIYENIQPHDQAA